MLQPLATGSQTYEAPPVLQRVFSIPAVAIERDTYYGRIDELTQALTALYGSYEPQQQWVLNVEQKNGVPQFQSMKHEVLVTHAFWHKTEGQNQVGCVVEPDKIAVVMQTLPKHPDMRYPFLKLWVEKTIPLWASIMEPKLKATVLEYVNVLSRRTTPDFVSSDGSLSIGDMLTVFSGFPGHHLGIVPPYDCQMGLAIDTKAHLFLNFRVKGLPQQIDNASAVRVDLQALINKEGIGLTVSEAVDSLDLLHKTVVDKFDTVFTDRAKAAFKSKTS